MLRIPGTINSRDKNTCKKKNDPRVKIVYRNYSLIMKSQPASFIESKAMNSFLNDFHSYLVQEEIEDKLMESDRQQIAELTGDDNNMKSQAGGNFGWIDQLLQTGVEDNRKNLLIWVLTPYLITVRGLDNNTAYNTLDACLEKCNDVRRLEPDKHAFQNRIKQCLDIA
jgi:hypothetical protein